MKISKLNYTQYHYSDDTISIEADREMAESIIAHITRMQEKQNKLQEICNNQAKLLKECSEFVDNELRESINQLNQF